jgi:hypothetical protein
VSIITILFNRVWFPPDQSNKIAKAFVDWLKINPPDRTIEKLLDFAQFSETRRPAIAVLAETKIPPNFFERYVGVLENYISSMREKQNSSPDYSKVRATGHISYGAPQRGNF